MTIPGPSILVTILLVMVVLNGGGAGDLVDDGTCGGGEACREEDRAVRLVRLAPGKVGDVRELKHVSGRTLEMKTVSVKPPIFEIPGFLSDSECDHLVALAQKKGLHPSVTYNNNNNNNNNNKKNSAVRVMDLDGNKKLDYSEMILTIENSYDIYLSEDDVKKMYATLDLDADHDGLLTPVELSSQPPHVLEDWVMTYVKKYPIKQSRFSEQVWLFPDTTNDNILKDLLVRVERLTGLPPVLIRKSDFQVVRYGPGGHYNAHHDSAPVVQGQQCCQRSQSAHCRICRFMTILFYLNDVEEGGGTAFPLAGNDTYDVHKLRQEHRVNLQQHCHDSNLVVAPSRGKAVVWYNHQVAEQSGWMGDLDEFTIHGGCPVVRGHKWIANLWIKTTNDKDKDLTER